MLNYLNSAGFTKTHKQLQQEAPDLMRNSFAFSCISSYCSSLSWSQINFQLDPASELSGDQVKKWTSVIRMEKKVHMIMVSFIPEHLTSPLSQIMHLEAKLAQAAEEMSHVGHLSVSGTKCLNKDWLSSSPANYVLGGHCNKVNAVKFHPVYSILTSASADVMVKI